MSVQTTIRMPTQIMKALRDESQRRGYTISDLIMFILHDQMF